MRFPYCPADGGADAQSRFGHGGRAETRPMRDLTKTHRVAAHQMRYRRVDRGRVEAADRAFPRIRLIDGLGHSAAGRKIRIIGINRRGEGNR